MMSILTVVLYGILFFFAFGIVVVIVASIIQRIRNPHRRKLKTEGKHIQKHGGGPETASQKASSESAWLTHTYWWLPLLVVAGLLFWNGYVDWPSQATPHDVSVWENQHIVLLFSCIVILIGTSFVPKWKAQTNIYQAMALVLIALMVLIPLYAYFSGGFGSSNEPNPALMKTAKPAETELIGGKTRIVSVPSGYNLCLRSSFWNNIRHVGFYVSYQKKPFVHYMCSRSEAERGACPTSTFDQFYFEPEQGYSVPDDWYMTPNWNPCQ